MYTVNKALKIHWYGFQCIQTTLSIHYKCKTRTDERFTNSRQGNCSKCLYTHDSTTVQRQIELRVETCFVRKLYISSSCRNCHFCVFSLCNSKRKVSSRANRASSHQTTLHTSTLHITSIPLLTTWSSKGSIRRLSFSQLPISSFLYSILFNNRHLCHK